jgi:chemotaxis protein CheD
MVDAAKAVFYPRIRNPKSEIRPKFEVTLETIQAPEPSLLEEIRVDMADARVESRPVSLVTNVGSCVAICLHDVINKSGGLAHIMLPAPNNSHDSLPYKYAETAVPALANSIRKLHSANSCIIAKISGGANMFSNLRSENMKVGERNAQAAREALTANRIRLLAEDIGGTCGRRIMFNVFDGSLCVTTMKGEVKKL